MSQFATRLSLSLGVLCLAACTPDHATAPTLFPETVDVSPGLTPQISWNPGGAVYSVTVTEVASGAVRWSALGQLQQNAIMSSVTYGSTPPGAIATANAVLPLVRGHEYRVTLGRVADHSQVVIVGSAIFRPGL